MTEFPQRQIGRTALRVTELGLGCATLGGSQIAVAPATAAEIVGAAWAAGVRYVDTAVLRSRLCRAWSGRTSDRRGSDRPCWRCSPRLAQGRRRGSEQCGGLLSK